MKAINSNVIQFTDIDDVIKYTNGKYINTATDLSSIKKVIDEEKDPDRFKGMTFYAFNFNDFIDIEAHELNCSNIEDTLHIAVCSLKLEDDPKSRIICIMTALNKNKQDGLSKMISKYNKENVFLISKKNVGSIELLVAIFDDRENPAWFSNFLDLTKGL